MHPNELEPSVLQLPESDDHSMIVVSGMNLRHIRFAYRMQAEFGDRVKAWYQLDSSQAKPSIQRTKTIGKAVPAASSSSPVQVLKDQIRKHGLISALKKVVSEFKTRLKIRNYYRSHITAEEKLFKAELEVLKSKMFLEPIKIHPSYVHTDEFRNEVQAIDPYFFLTLGGPLYRKPLLESIRGAAINQHAGHSPDYKGSQTIEWALYHRSLEHVSSTVHITVTGADAGPIIRRSTPCIFTEDNVPTIFARVVALGTEMMIESIKEIIENKEVTCYYQPEEEGRTYLSKEFDRDVITSIQSDVDRGWIRTALAKQWNY